MGSPTEPANRGPLTCMDFVYGRGGHPLSLRLVVIMLESSMEKPRNQGDCTADFLIHAKGKEYRCCIIGGSKSNDMLMDDLASQSSNSSNCTLFSK